MSMIEKKYCLDANVLIQAWQKYYSPKICPGYWDHALKENAIVVTKEEKVTAINTTKIKIPNVCEKMNVPWINDFQLILELGIRFKCEIDK